MPTFNLSGADPTRRHNLLRLIARNLAFFGTALLGAATLVWLVPDHVAAPLAPIYALVMIVLAHRWFSPNRRPASESAATTRIDEGLSDDERGR
jgi:uncharacterized membrane protein YoaK (UPF0700 family)